VEEGPLTAAEEKLVEAHWRLFNSNIEQDLLAQREPSCYTRLMEEALNGAFGIFDKYMFSFHKQNGDLREPVPVTSQRRNRGPSSDSRREATRKAKSPTSRAGRREA
jgi:hypothetical protein